MFKTGLVEQSFSNAEKLTCKKVKQETIYQKQLVIRGAQTPEPWKHVKHLTAFLPYMHNCALLLYMKQLPD